MSANNNQHKSKVLANQFALFNTLNYPPRFVNVFLLNITGFLQHALSHATPIDPRLNQPFSLTELLSAVQDTINTTPGPDNTCYEMFKHMSTKLLDVMLQLFDKIWFTGKIPPSWLHSIIIAIPKPNKPSHLPSSCRPISSGKSRIIFLLERSSICQYPPKISAINIKKQSRACLLLAHPVLYILKIQKTYGTFWKPPF